VVVEKPIQTSNPFLKIGTVNNNPFLKPEANNSTLLTKNSPFTTSGT